MGGLQARHTLSNPTRGAGVLYHVVTKITKDPCFLECYPQKAQQLYTLLNFLKPLSCLTRSKKSTKAITSSHKPVIGHAKACPFLCSFCTPVMAEGVPSLDFCVGVERHPVDLWMRLRRSPKKGGGHVTLLKLDAKMSRRERTVAQAAARRPERLGDQGG